MIRAATVALFAFGASACAEDHTPPHDIWRDGPSIPIATGLDGRFEAFATSDGERLYYLGGIIGYGTDAAVASPVDSVSVLEPGANAWTEGPALPSDCAKHHLMVAVIDRALYVLGGFDGILGRTAGEAFRPIAAAYVLREGVWQRLADAPLARGAATAQVLAGKIHVVGGSTTEGVAPFADHYEYDPQSNAWLARAPLPTAREHLASCALGGKMLVVGGWIGPGDEAQRLADLYDPVTDSWETVPAMPTARGGLAAVSIGDECHVLGGEDWKLPRPGTFSVHEVFSLAQRTWSSRAAMPVAMHGIGAALWRGEIWLVGGGPSQGNSYTTRVSAYRP